MSTSEITSEAIDRLVDGELSAAERRELLLRLEDSDDGWRRCALAFLEAAAWKREFTATVAAPSMDATRARDDSGSHSWRTLRFFALGASLLIAFWLGGRTGKQADEPLLAVTDSIPSAGIEQSVAAPQGEPVSNDDVITLWAHDANGVAQPLHVSLIDADSIDLQFGLNRKPQVTPEQERWLKDRGYQVESRRRYAPLWLEHGQPLMVPVEDTHIIPVGREVL